MLIQNLTEEVTSLNIYVSTTDKSLIINIPADGEYRLLIYDIQGKPVYYDEMQLQKNTIFKAGISELPPGVYIITLESERLKERTKVLVPQF